MACVLCLGLIGGAFAYFTDTETSNNNTFTAGYMNLVLDVNNPVGNIVLDNMAPNHPSGLFDITFKNTGSLAGTLSYDISLANATETNTWAPDGTGTDMSAYDFATQVNITTLKWGSDDILGTITGIAGNGAAPLTLAELANYGWFSDAGVTLAATTGTQTVTYGFTLDADAGDAYQGDAVTMILDAKLTSN